VFDTDCSISMSLIQEDVIGEIIKPPKDSLKDLKGKERVVGVGRVKWTVLDIYSVS
jgi:hypothetical protein